MENFNVVLPDTNGGWSYLTKAWKGDPGRTYNRDLAVVYKNREKAEKGIVAAKKTHTTRPRNYIIVPVDQEPPM